MYSFVSVSEEKSANEVVKQNTCSWIMFCNFHVPILLWDEFCNLIRLSKIRIGERYVFGFKLCEHRL